MDNQHIFVMANNKYILYVVRKESTSLMEILVRILQKKFN